MVSQSLWRSSSGGYRVYTRAYDRIIDSTRLTRELPAAAVGAAAAEAAWREFRGGLADWRTRLRLRALELQNEWEPRLGRARLAQTAVTLLVDHSGSMRGHRVLLAALAVEFMEALLDSLGCRCEVLGFTTVSWQGGLSREAWKAAGKPPAPGRLCDLLHIVYRAFAQRRPANLAMLFNEFVLHENVDGEALLWASDRLGADPGGARALIAISDGAPVDDSTLMENGSGILADHLRHVISEIQAGQDIALGEISLEASPRRFYPDSVGVWTFEELADRVGTLLMRTLSRAIALAGRDR